ncbi:MAG: hypothetical protein HQL50_03820 [Magnetococcales bacterium]|nr:hypothetical protein [Magnetococcales bacterium]
MSIRLLVTLGPSSLNKETIQKLANEGVTLFRLNMSHTDLDVLPDLIKLVQSSSDVPLCLDSEGAQIRNQNMDGGAVMFKTGETVKIHYDTVLGDANTISFTPKGIAKQLQKGDRIRVDFDSMQLLVTELNDDHCLATVEQGGKVGSNKASDVDRYLKLDPITPKDREAIKIGRQFNIKHFALSFSDSRASVDEMRSLTGEDTWIISKVESMPGLANLADILDASDEVLIDRGDLSRQVPLEKIPFVQRRIIAAGRSQGTPVAVATNLMESMIDSNLPTRAEINDVVSTLLMGANSLVLAAETAVGQFPYETVVMVKKLISGFERWTPNNSMQEILNDETGNPGKYDLSYYRAS